MKLFTLSLALMACASCSAESGKAYIDGISAAMYRMEGHGALRSESEHYHDNDIRSEQ